MIGGTEYRILGTVMSLLRTTNSVSNKVGLSLHLDAGVKLLSSLAGCYGTVAPSGPPDGLPPFGVVT